MKVVLINNYPMDHAWELWQQKKYPGNHLWGATHLHEYGIDVEILTHTKYSLLKKISSKVKILGDLDQQLRILLKKEKYDLVYSAHDLTTSLLAFFRYIGIFNKPVVIVVHRSFKKKFLGKLFVHFFIKNHDKLLCLSSNIRDQLRDRFDIPEAKLSVLEWAVELPFYQFKENNAYEEAKSDKTAFIISAGSTGRDYKTLIKAFQEINYPLKIYGAGDSTLTISPIPLNVISTGEKILPFEELIKEYKKAYAVAIPLNIPVDRTDTVTQIGNTSLLEAMAMGKAVIMTRNRQIDIDIEKEGIGIFVEPGDMKGWQQAITYLLDHPHETKEMGKKARSLCENKYNLEKFSAKLAYLLKSVLEESLIKNNN